MVYSSPMVYLIRLFLSEKAVLWQFRLYKYLEDIQIIVIFADENKIVMKDVEKKSHIDESESAGIAAEPVGAAVREDMSSYGYDIDNWPGMPLVGPANIDEMNVRIDLAEQEMDHDNGFSWDQVMLDAQSIVNRYANTIH